MKRLLDARVGPLAGAAIYAATVATVYGAIAWAEAIAGAR